MNVSTPALEVPTFLEVAAQRLSRGRPGTLTSSGARSTLAPPAIPDLGVSIGEKLTRRLAQQVRWWPGTIPLESPVPANYVHTPGPWLRVQVTHFEIAPPPLKTLFVMADVSLRRPGDQGAPYFTRKKVYSGVIHGGGKLDEERLAVDGSLLAREMDRAAAWLADELVKDLGQN